MVDLKLHFPNGFFDEEIRNGYTVTAETKELWAVQLDLLVEFDRVCKQYDIQYMACGGTMLGAVRHQGYIPWDDDIDLMMSWENYKRLLMIGSKEFRHPYYFQTGYNDKGTVIGHAQLRNSNTTAIRSVDLTKKYNFNQGIFIDIFCLDHIPDDSDEQELFFKEIEKKRLAVLRASKYAYRYTSAVRKTKVGINRLKWDVAHAFSIMTRLEERRFKDYDECLHRYNEQLTEREGILCLLALGDRGRWFTKDLKSDIVYKPFEFLEIPIPTNYEEILNILYGDWHTFVIGTSLHGELVIDTEQTYKEYIR